MDEIGHDDGLLEGKVESVFWRIAFLFMVDDTVDECVSEGGIDV